jgi:hypothetical protein
MSDANYYKKIHTMLSEGKIKDIDTDRKEKAVAAKKEKKEKKKYDSDTDYMLKMAAKGIADVEKKADVKKKASLMISAYLRKKSAPDSLTLEAFFFTSAIPFAAILSI